MTKVKEGFHKPWTWDESLDKYLGSLPGQAGYSLSEHRPSQDAERTEGQVALSEEPPSAP